MKCVKIQNFSPKKRTYAKNIHKKISVKLGQSVQKKSAKKLKYKTKHASRAGGIFPPVSKKPPLTLMAVTEPYANRSFLRPPTEVSVSKLGRNTVLSGSGNARLWGINAQTRAGGRAGGRGGFKPRPS